MSHTTAIDTVVVKDIEALKMTAKALTKAGIKCSVVKNAAPRLYYADQLQRAPHNRPSEICDYILRLDGCKYDIGFLKNKDGSYYPVTDFHAGYVASVLGVACTPEKVRERIAKRNEEIAKWHKTAKPGQVCPLKELTTFDVHCQYAVGKFTREYATHAMTRMAFMRGQKCKEVIRPDGTRAVKVTL